MKVNKIICGDTKTELSKLPTESVNCVVTSPPYWGLRDYGIDPVIWDGDKDCKHEWGNKIIRDNKSYLSRYANEKSTLTTGTTQKRKEELQQKYNKKTEYSFCLKCGAWKGSLGLEPTFELYIKHLCDIFNEVKRVLRKDGTCWVNLGDTYNSHSAKSKNVGGFEGKQMRNNKAYSESKIVMKKTGVADKSLCLIPQRFAIEMVNRGWILRNTLIWHKPNCMPSSAKDRFTVDFEYVYFFVKSKKYWFEQQFEAQYWNGQSGKKNCRNNEIGRSDNANKSMNSGGVNSKGRNKRAVWTIPTKPFPEAHFAVYPEKLIEPMIKAGCPKGGIIIDPFSGAGTTAVVAKKLGRKYLGIEIKQEYIGMANKRINKIPELLFERR